LICPAFDQWRHPWPYPDDMPVDPLELSPDAYVTFVIGLTARKDVDIEETVRWVWRELVRLNGREADVIPRRLPLLVDGCESLLVASSLPDQVVAAGKNVLKDARDSHGARNVLVHEQWTNDENGRWVRGHNPLKDRHPAWTVSQFDDVLRKLTRVSERMYSLLNVVRAHREDTLDDIYRFDLAVIEDRFTMDDDGKMIAH
jgi:hypothetical protein